MQTNDNRQMNFLKNAKEHRNQEFSNEINFGIK